MNNENRNNTIELRGTVEQKLKKVDKYEKNYLILRLRGEEKAVFVFSTKVSDTRWDEIEEDKEFIFTVVKGNEDSNILVDFKTV